MDYSKRDLVISTDQSRLDLVMIHGFLKESYWARDIPFEVVEKSVRNSLCFGMYESEKQIGFARLITDYSVFAMLADVFILEPYRGKGLSKWLMECIMAYPELKGLRMWLLGTRDAHGLYKQFGFVPLKNPEFFMQIHHPDIYMRKKDIQ